MCWPLSGPSLLISFENELGAQEAIKQLMELTILARKRDLYGDGAAQIIGTDGNRYDTQRTQTTPPRPYVYQGPQEIDRMGAIGFLEQEAERVGGVTVKQAGYDRYTITYQPAEVTRYITVTYKEAAALFDRIATGTGTDGFIEAIGAKNTETSKNENEVLVRYRCVREPCNWIGEYYIPEEQAKPQFTCSRCGGPTWTEPEKEK